MQDEIKIQSFVELWEHISENERILVDVLRQIVSDTLPESSEKITCNVPYFFGKKRICMIWPASIPRGGVRQGVLFGFSQGFRLKDENNYLDHGSNKRIFYKIYKSVEDIDEEAIVGLLKEAWETDQSFK